MEANVFVVKLRDRGLYWNKTWKSTLSLLFTGKLELFTAFTKVGEISVKCLDFLGKLRTL